MNRQQGRIDFNLGVESDKAEFSEFIHVWGRSTALRTLQESPSWDCAKGDNQAFRD
jgi:hypothetical protein